MSTLKRSSQWICISKIQGKRKNTWNIFNPSFYVSSFSKAVYKQCLFLNIGMNDSKPIIKVPPYVPYTLYLLALVWYIDAHFLFFIAQKKIVLTPQNDITWLSPRKGHFCKLLLAYTISLLRVSISDFLMIALP